VALVQKVVAMSTAYADEIKRIPGTLVVNPTDLSLAYPYGGTVLGVVRAIEIDLGQRVRMVVDEGGGGGHVQGIRLGQASALHAVLRSWDKDMVSALFPNTTVVEGLPLQLNQEFGSGVQPPGVFATDVSATVKLLFAPTAPLHHEGFLLYRAFPHAQEAARMQASLTKEIGVAVSFMGLPDDSTRRHAVGFLERMTL
jgi:hypothetical protein